MTELEIWICIALFGPLVLGICLCSRTDEQDETFRKALRWWDEGED